MTRNQKTKKIIGYYKVDEIYFKRCKGAVKTGREKDYLFFKLAEIKGLDMNFTLGNLGQRGYFFTNSYVFNRFLREGDKDILKLNSLEKIREWQEKKRRCKKVVIKRKKFKLNKDNVDISEIEILCL